MIAAGAILAAALSAAAQGADAGASDAGTPMIALDAGTPVVESAKRDALLGGRHWRLVTQNGVVHVWRPGGYVAKTAGIVLYVHGYYTDVDGAWRDHRLARQFQESGENALFVAPEAPNGGPQDVQFKDLGELLATVSRLTQQPLPPGPVIAVGHSGAYRTLAHWLAYEPLLELYLLDALYSNEPEFDAWLDAGPHPELKRLVMVGYETNVHSEAFCGGERFEAAAKRNDVPRRFTELTAKERRAQILYLQSQYDHMQIVAGGRVIPLLLRLSPLRRL